MCGRFPSGSAPLPVLSRPLITRLYEKTRPILETAPSKDRSALACDLCGVPLENPFLLSSSVVASSCDMCARAFEAGWAGISFKTISTMDIHEASPRFSSISGNNREIIGFKNIDQLSEHSVTGNMAFFRQLKRNYPHKVILHHGAE